MLFKKKEDVEAEPCSDLSKAKDVSEKYSQLSKCCEVLAEVDLEENDLVDIYRQGWKFSAYAIKLSGIDINEVYDYIKILAIKRKEEIEAELTQL